MVYSSNFALRFMGNTVFSYNNGCALAVLGSWVDFMVAVCFLQHNGTNDGAVKILGSAYLLLNENTDPKFVQN